MQCTKNACTIIRIMIHQPASSFYGAQTREFILESEELLKLHKSLTMVYVQRIGKPLWVVLKTRKEMFLLCQLLKQLIRNVGQPIRNITKFATLRGCPQCQGTCTRVLFASNFRGAHSRLTRTITQQRIRALVFAHWDKDRKKRDFGRLWITQINAVISGVGVSYSYSRLIHNLYKKQLLLNRKIFAQIAVSNRNCLYMISNEIRK
ncbi:hypothetical protein E1A91_D04G094700v1 [Gossypium mustelinum]|uniref:Large ribosomal subunit protein bL20c n=1 Tax=Gossypium mustelinum TaxID=34275 RepID=A0A5D2VBV9_GOSMU|nr:hypothetical protein E1A91_D04G094700v1 [Gossypium mustelinum]